MCCWKHTVVGCNIYNSEELLFSGMMGSTNDDTFLTDRIIRYLFVSINIQSYLMRNFTEGLLLERFLIYNINYISINSMYHFYDVPFFVSSL